MLSWTELLSLAVHELRTPAGVVGGYLRMLQSDAADPLTERQLKMITEAEKSCARLVAIVAEMSEFSKLEAGLIEMARQPVDLFPLVEEVANHMHESQDRGVRIEVGGAAKGAMIQGDQLRLRQAFSSIFKAIVREQTAACTVVVDRRLVDRGDGSSSAIIVIAQAETVQTAYESAPAPFDEKRGGMGLSLPLARHVIEGHGGKIAAPSGAAVRGAAIVTLPIPESSR
jgi:signal transduction histidine kinase